MSTITQANFWKDTGYTEGCMEVPGLSDTLPSPDLTFSDLNPTKARMFSELRVPEDYITMLDYSYLSISLDNNNGSDKVFYGWIDSIELLSDSYNAPITIVHWHVDLWRTYLSQAVFGSGMVIRKPYTSGMVMPSQTPQYRYVNALNPIALDESDNIWWVIINYTEDSGSNVTTEVLDPNTNTTTITSTSTVATSVTTRVCPIIRSSATLANTRAYLSSTVRGPSIADFMVGMWDERWGLDPKNIISAFLSPVAPCDYTGDGTSGSPCVLNSSYWTLGTYTQGTNIYGYYEQSYSGSVFNGFTEREQTLSDIISTSDTMRFIVQGLDGETVGELPWGMAVNKLYYRVVSSTTSCYVQIRCTSADGVNNRYVAHQIGMCFTIPCLALDLTENTWSSYYLSGERQYAIDQRKLQADQRGIEGGMEIVQNTLFGAIGGASSAGSSLAGLFGAGVAGAVVGGTSAGLATAGEIAIQQAWLRGEYNDRMTQMEDTYHASQPDGLLLPGSGFDALFHNQQIRIVPVEIDQYSLDQYNANLTLYGANVSEPTSDCTSLVQTGGPLQIQNLIVKGDIPPSAKATIKMRFQQGVILK